MTQYTARLTGAVPFNLQETFECGQCFRWLPGDDGSYTGVVGRNVITLRADGDDLLVAGLDQAEAEQRLIPYLALDEDYAAIQEQFRRNTQLAQAVDYARGIRVLRQDRWEALCSFIISQNNNIKRIRGIVETLCNTWGEPLPGGRSSFPGPEVLASLTEEDLQPLRSGFRAKYILDAARKTASGEVDLDHVASLPTEEAAAELCRIRGGGHQGGPLCAALRVPPHRMPAGGCVDEAGDVHHVSPGTPGGTAALCGHCPTVSVPLFPQPSGTV